MSICLPPSSHDCWHNVFLLNVVVCCNQNKTVYRRNQKYLCCEGLLDEQEPEQKTQRMLGNNRGRQSYMFTSTQGSYFFYSFTVEQKSGSRDARLNPVSNSERLKPGGRTAGVQTDDRTTGV